MLFLRQNELLSFFPPTVPRDLAMELGKMQKSCVKVYKVTRSDSSFCNLNRPTWRKWARSATIAVEVSNGLRGFCWTSLCDKWPNLSAQPKKSLLKEMQSSCTTLIQVETWKEFAGGDPRNNESSSIHRKKITKLYSFTGGNNNTIVRKKKLNKKNHTRT